MRKSLTFNGERKSWLYLLEGRSKSPFAPIRNNLLYVPGMPGAYVQSKETGVLYISQPIGFVARNDEEALRIKDELAEWLITDQAVELHFDDEPGRTYYAELEGTIEDYQKFVDQRKGYITFICVDPYSYGDEQVYQFESDFITIENKGTAKAKPIIELEVLQPVTFAMIQNQLEQYQMIGRPIDIENQAPYVKYERVFYDDANTLSGWNTAATGEIDGVISGSMEAVNDRFQAATYGTGTGWHGPAIKKSLTETLKDFRLSTYIALDNSGVAVGRIELYLLDASGNQVAKVAMKDTQSGRALGFGEARAGNALNNHYLINEYGDREGNWNNFAGILRIEREGVFWRAYFAKGNSVDGYHTRRFANWEDNENKYTAPIAQVVVHMGQHGGMAPITGGIYSISVDKINPEPSGGIPYIADVGDIIQFNHVEKMIYINGEPRMDLKDFGGSFFDLQKGENQLVVHPSDAFNTSLKYRERFR